MTFVRCPSCSATVADPNPVYACPACGQRLQWRPVVAPVGPVQLGLFGEVVPAAESDPVSRQRRRMPSPAVDTGGRSQSKRRSHQDALAAATELFHLDDTTAADALVRARSLLTGQSAADLREAVLGGAWFLATALRSIEAVNPGAGLEMLQALGITLARMDEKA
jgi:hypothetical protein